jgi:hypothetical protein
VSGAPAPAGGVVRGLSGAAFAFLEDRLVFFEVTGVLGKKKQTMKSAEFHGEFFGRGFLRMQQEVVSSPPKSFSFSFSYSFSKHPGDGENENE